MPTNEPARLSETVVLSDEELAVNWLRRELTSTLKGLEDNALSTRITRNYNPDPVVRPSGIELGSMDDSDWTIAEGEFNQWPEEQEAELDRLEGEEQALSDKLSGLLEDQTKLGEKSPVVIRKLALLEKERLASLAAREKRELEKKQGVHFEGTEEVVGLIDKLKAAEKSGFFKNGKSVNGWSLVYTNQEGYAYHLNESQGPLGGFDASISIGKDPLEREPGLTNVRFTNLQGIHAEKIDYGTKVDRNGIGLFFNIKKNLIKNHHASEVKPTLQFGGHGSFQLDHAASDTGFTQAKFDEFRSALKSLVSGIQEGTVKPPQSPER